MIKFKVKTGDNVVVITGKDKGKQGVITKVLPKESRVVVAGVNLARKHRKATREEEGKIDIIPLPIHVSNVALFDSETMQKSKVSFAFENGVKQRVYRKTGKIVAENK